MSGDIIKVRCLHSACGLSASWHHTACFHLFNYQCLSSKAYRSMYVWSYGAEQLQGRALFHSLIDRGKKNKHTVYSTNALRMDYLGMCSRGCCALQSSVQDASVYTAKEGRRICLSNTSNSSAQIHYSGWQQHLDGPLYMT